MTIQEKAVEAWHQHLKEVSENERELAAQELEERRRTVIEVAERFKEWYGSPADKVEGTEYHECADVYHDGLHLQVFVDDPKELYVILLGTCSECGEEVESNTFTTLWELGRLLEDGFKAADWHIKEEHGGG
jgi:hypothetical protein